MVSIRVAYITTELAVRKNLEWAVTGDEAPCLGHVINRILHFLLAPECVSVHPPPEAAAEGRCMRATRALRPGEMLFSAEASFVFIKSSARKRVCAGCRGVGVRRLERVCRTCHIVHYCSAGCEARDRALHKPVCHLLPLASKFRLRKSGKSSNRGMIPVDHDVFQRAMWFLLDARFRDLPLDQLLLLQHDVGGWSENEVDAYGCVANFVVEFLREHLPDDPVLTAVSAEDVCSIISRLQLNSFGLTSCGKDGQDMGLLLFTQMSFFNHSCAPNTVMEVVDNCQYLFARGPVSSHEEVFHNYVLLDQPLAVRRKQLKESFDFVCRCTRCTREEVATPKGRKGRRT